MSSLASFRRAQSGDGSLQNQTAFPAVQGASMSNNRPPPIKSSPKPPPKDGDGNHVHNQILLDLPPKEREMLFPKLEFVRLKTHHVLHEPGDTLKSAYF